MSFSKFLPAFVKNAYVDISAKIQLVREYCYWFKRDIKYSSLKGGEQSDLSTLMTDIHVLEKGITMPNRRLGFGYDRVRKIIRECKEDIEKYTPSHFEIQAALSDLEQYKNVHLEHNFKMADDISLGIDDLLKFKTESFVECFDSTPDDLFKQTSDFKEFAHSRHTVRWFSEEPVSLDLLKKAVELAQTAPSACNRQSTRCYIISSPEAKQKLLNLQNGNRGFGHLADKFILITGDMKCWNFKRRTSAFLDAGIFTQNLLYALHYYKICACTLNAHLSLQGQRELRDLVGYADSEVPVVYIAVGNAPDSFMIAGSPRVQVNNICKIV